MPPRRRSGRLGSQNDSQTSVDEPEPKKNVKSSPKQATAAAKGKPSPKRGRSTRNAKKGSASSPIGKKADKSLDEEELRALAEEEVDADLEALEEADRDKTFAAGETTADVIEEVEEEEEKPTGSKKARSRGASSSKKRTPLFDVISATKTQPSAIAVAVEDWIRDYDADKANALLELVNFLIKASGCTDRTVTAKQFDSMDAGEALSKITTPSFVKTAEGLYPLSKPGAPGRLFKSHFLDLWSKIVHKVPNRVLYEDDLFDHLFDWLEAFAYSKARSFRHTGTAAAMQIVSALAKVAVRVKKEHEVVSRQLIAEKRHNATGARARALSKKVEELDARLDTLHSLMEESLVQRIFAHRYRDIAAEVRALCMESLGQWMTTYPDVFVDVEFLKYLGWALFDRDRFVRLAALGSLEPLFRDAAIEARDTSASSSTGSRRSSQSSQSQSQSQNESVEATLLSKLDGSPSFLDKQKARLVQMTRDVDQEVAVLAIQLCGYLAAMRKLTSEDLGGLHELLSSASEPIRSAAADFASSYLFESVVPQSVSSPAQVSHVSIRALLELIEDASLTPDFPNYVVDALWRKLPALKEWSVMSDLLLAEDTETNDPSLRQLDPSQQKLLARLAAACATRATGGSIITNGSTVSPDEAAAARDTLTKHFAGVLPRLLDRFSGDTDVLAELLMLPQSFALSYFSIKRQRPALSAVLEGLRSSFSRHSSIDILSGAAATLRIFRTSLDGSASAEVDVVVRQLVDDVIEAVDKAVAPFAISPQQSKKRRRSQPTDEFTGVTVALSRLYALVQSIDVDSLSSKGLHPCLAAAMMTVRAHTGGAETEECRLLVLKIALLHNGHSLRRLDQDSSDAPKIREQARWLFSELEDALEDASKSAWHDTGSDEAPPVCKFAGLGDEVFAVTLQAMLLFSPAMKQSTLVMVASASLQELLIARYENRCDEFETHAASDSAVIRLSCEKSANQMLQSLVPGVGFGLISSALFPRVVARYLRQGKDFESTMKELVRHLRERAPREFWKVVVGTLQIAFREVDYDSPQTLKDFQKLAARLALVFGVGRTNANLGPLLFQVISEGVLVAVASVADHPADRANKWVFVSEGIARFLPKLPTQKHGVGAGKLLQFCETRPEHAGIDLTGPTHGHRTEDIGWFSFLGALEKIARSQGASISSQYETLCSKLEKANGSVQPAAKKSRKRGAAALEEDEASDDIEIPEDAESAVDARDRRASRRRSSVASQEVQEEPASEEEGEAPRKRARRGRR